MALLTAQPVSRAGLAPVYSAVNASDTIQPIVGSLLFLHVKNTNASPNNVTVQDGGKTPAGNSGSTSAVVVPATTGDRMIGPLPASLADPVTGLITVTHSNVTNGTCALVAVPITG